MSVQHPAADSAGEDADAQAGDGVRRRPAPARSGGRCARSQRRRQRVPAHRVQVDGARAALRLAGSALSQAISSRFAGIALILCCLMLICFFFGIIHYSFNHYFQFYY